MYNKKEICMRSRNKTLVTKTYTKITFEKADAGSTMQIRTPITPVSQPQQRKYDQYLFTHIYKTKYYDKNHTNGKNKQEQIQEYNNTPRNIFTYASIYNGIKLIDILICPFKNY